MYRSYARDMDPVSLVACRQQRVTLPPTASMTVLRGKLDTDQRIGQPVCCGVSGALFSRAVALSIAVDDFAKGFYAFNVRDTYGLGPYAH
jgi:hypothetical protein